MLWLALAPVQELAGQDLIPFLLTSFCPFCGSTQLASCRYNIIFHAPSSCRTLQFVDRTLFQHLPGQRLPLFDLCVHNSTAFAHQVSRFLSNCFSKAPSCSRRTGGRCECGWLIVGVCVFVCSMSVSLSVSMSVSVACDCACVCVFLHASMHLHMNTY